MSKISLTNKILIAMLFGIILGLLIHYFAATQGTIQRYLVEGILFVIGKLYISSLKMMVVPLVFVSLINGVSSLADISVVGRMGLKSILLYVSTTAIAITISLLIAFLINPGKTTEITTDSAQFVAKEAPSIAQTIINIIPTTKEPS